MSDIYFYQSTVADELGNDIDIHAADIDNDGDRDILGSISIDDQISWWEYNSSDGTLTEHIVTNDINSVYDIYPEDIDSDGNVDIVAGSEDAFWWSNDNGDGTTWTENTISTNAAYNIYAEDFDGDNDPDIFTTFGGIYYYENADGNGDSWNTTQIDDPSNSIDNGQYLAIGDIDGDGNLDAITAEDSSNTGIYWWNNSDGDFSNSQSQTVDADIRYVRDLEAEDIDGDGDIDVLSTDNVNDSIIWWSNDNGDGSSWTEYTIDNDFDGRDTYAEDVDGDGDLDILGAALNDDEIAWWENTAGDASSWTKHTLDDAFDGARKVHADDIDDDGDIDILGAPYSDEIAWWENGRYIKEGDTFSYDLSGASSTVTFTITDDTAEEGVDYWIEDGDGNLLAGSNGTYSTDSDTLVIKAIDDYVYDPIEKDFTLTFDNYDLDGATTFDHTIVDAAPVVSIADYTTNIYETPLDFGDVATFDGSDDYIEVASDSSLDLSDTGEFTLEAWIYSTVDDNSYHGILGYHSDSTAKRYPGMWIRNQTGIHFGFGDGDNWNKATVEDAIAANQWNHVATTFDGTSYKLYVNGEEIYSTDEYAGRVPYNTQQLTIGKVDNYFEGKIDEVRVWNTARTASEIEDNLYSPLEGDEDSLVAYYNFNEDYVDGTTVADLTENANDATFTNGDNDYFETFPDIVGQIDLELSNQVTSDAGVIVNYQLDSDAVQGTDFYSSQLDISTVDDDAPTNSVYIAPYQDSTTIYLTALPDAEVEDTEDLTVTLLPDYNQALVLDGVDDYVELADPNVDGVLDTGSSALTIATWVKPDTLSSSASNHSTQNVFLALASDADNDILEVGISDDGNLLVYLDLDGDDNSAIELGNGELTTDDWHSVAIAFDSGNLTAYLDGNKYSHTYSGSEFDDPDSSPLTIGATLHSDIYYDGAIDHLTIWDIALDDTEDDSTVNIYDALYGSPTEAEENLVGYWNFNQSNVDGTVISDASANDNDGTIYNGNQALSFDGSDDNIQIPGGNGEFGDFSTSDFSIELWFKTTDESGTLIGADGSDFWEVYLDNGQAVFDFETGNNNSTAAVSSDTVNDGEWHHIAAVRTGSRTGDLYLDGEYVASVSNSNNSSIETTSDVYIGSSTSSSNYFEGEIDEVRVWSDERSSDEINDNLDQSLVGDEDNLIAYYNFDDDTATDLSDNGNDGTVNGATSVDNDNENLTSDASFSDSIAYDPFSTGDATYGIEESQSVDLSLENNIAYSAGMAIADEYGEEVSADNEILLDADGNANFTLKLTSQPSDTVTVDFGDSSYDFDASNWDEPESISLQIDSDLAFTVSSTNDSNYNFSGTLYVTDTSDAVKLKVTEGGTELAETILPTVAITSTTDAYPDEDTAGEVSVEVSEITTEDAITVPFGVDATTTTEVASDSLENLIFLDTSAYFDGEDDYIAIANSSDIDLSGEVTMEAYIKIDSFDRAWQTILSKGDGWQLSRNNETDHLYFGYGDSLGVAGSTDIADGEWHHVAGVYNGSQLLVYVDGELDASSTTSVDSYVANDYNLQIGSNEAQTDRNFHGQIDEVRLWDVSRSQEEIQDGMVQSLAGTESGLLGYWTFDDDAVTDLSGNGYDGTLTNGLASTDSNFVDSYFHKGTLSIADTEDAGEATAIVEISGTDTEEEDDQSATVTLQSGDEYNLDLNNDSESIAIDYDEPGIELGKLVTVGSLDLGDGGDSLLDIELASLTETDSGSYLATINLALAEEITGDEVVTLTFDDDDNTSITFDADDWDETQQVSITSDLDHTISFSSSDADSEYSDRTAEIDISTDDLNITFNTSNELLDIELALLTETDSGSYLATINLALAEEITGDEIVTLTFDDDDNTSITFDADNWDETQQVSITSNLDHTISFSSSDSDSDYNDKTVDLDISSTVLDISFDSSDASVVTTEDGDSNEFSVSLETQPSADVTLNLAIEDSDTLEGAFADGSTTKTLTFTPDNWDTYQTVEVTGVDDSEYDGNTSYSITIESTSDDPDYDGLSKNLEITNEDNETEVDPEITADDQSTSDTDIYAGVSSIADEISEGTTTYFEINLTDSDGNPTSFDEDTIVNYEVRGGSAVSGEDFAPLTGQVAIAAGESSSTIDLEDYAEGTELETYDDDIDEDDETVQVNLVSPGHDIVVTTAYDAEAGTIALQLDDADDRGSFDLEAGDELFFSNGSNIVIEEAVTLSETEPTEVSVTLESGNEISVGETSRVYEDNYQLDNDIAEISDTITITDDDTAEVIITSDAEGTESLTSLETEEESGTSDTFYLQLTSEPTDNVLVYLGSTDSDEGLLSDSNETFEDTIKVFFTPSNWNTPQEINLKSVDDDEDDGDVSYQILSHFISDDFKYNEDTLPLLVSSDFDGSDETATISLVIDDISIDNAVLPAGTELSFPNGMILTVAEDVTLSNSEATEVAFSDLQTANQILADTTAGIDEDVTLVVTEDYEAGTIGLQIDEDSNVEELTLDAGEEIAFSNGAVVTITEATTLTSSDTTEVNVTLDEYLLQVELTEVDVDTTADVAIDSSDDDSETVELIVTNAYSSDSDSIGLIINDDTVDSLDLTAGTVITFSNDVELTLTEDVTLINSDAVGVSVEVESGDNSEVLTYYTETVADNLDVTNIDDDTAGVTITASDTSTTEGYGNNYFSVNLDSQPTEEVSVTFNPSNDDIQLADEFDGESYTVTFDADNWSIPQNVNVTAVDDFDVEYDHTSTISVDVTSDDTNYEGITTTPEDIEIFIADNDLPIASIETIASANEAGAPGDFVITLDEPAPFGFDATGIEVSYEIDSSSTADVNTDDDETDDVQPITDSVRIAPGQTQSQIIAFPIDDFKVEGVPLEVTSDYSSGAIDLAIDTDNISDSLLEDLASSGLTIAEGTELTFGSGEVVTVDETVSLEITTSGDSYTGVSQSIDVTYDGSAGITTDDTTSVPEETIAIDLSTGDDYEISPDAASATLSIEDNDKPGVRIIEVGDRTIVNEDGTTEFYVSLLSQPESDVEIALDTSETTKDLLVESGSVDTENNTVNLQLDPDSNVSSLLLQAGETLNEGYTVSQDTIITSDEYISVTLDEDLSDFDETTLSYSYRELGFDDDASESTTLTFDANNWYELQTVTVAGIDDSVVESVDYHTSDLTYTVTSDDSTYNGFEVAPQTIDIIDRTFDSDEVTESLTEGFYALQDGIDSISVPIIGNLDGVAPSFIEDFIDDLISEIKSADEVTAETITDAFEVALGVEDIVEITDLSSDNIEFLVSFDDSQTADLPIDLDLGLSALGIGLETNGAIEASFDYGIDLAFGINTEDGFYLNTDDTAFEVGAGLAFSDLGDDESIATGTLGFLQLDVSDGDNGGTGLGAEFVVTLEDPDTEGEDDEAAAQLTLSELTNARDNSDDLFDFIQYGFSGEALLDLGISTSVEGDTSFPSFNFDLYSELPLFNYANADDEEDTSGAIVTLAEDISRSDLSTDKAEDISVNISADEDDEDSSSIIRLNKGTELSFKDDDEELVSVILDETYTFSEDELDETQTIAVTLAEDDNNTETTITKDAEAQLVSSDFSLEFNNIELDLGEFVTDLMSPVIDFAGELIEPFEPVIEVLETEIELIDTLGLVDDYDSNGDGEVSLLEVASALAEAFGSSDSTVDYTKFFDAVSGIIDLVDTVNDLESQIESGTLAIDFGNYVLENFNAASDSEDISTYDTEDNGDASELSDDTSDQTTSQGSTISSFFDQLDELGINIPLIEDPFTAINLLLGQDVDLVTYDVPELDIEFAIEQEFPIFGSISGLLEGGFSVYSDLVLGFDTYGISQWAENDFEFADSYQILDGFYLSDIDPDTGEDVDELTLDATIAAGVEASAVVASASVTGGITGTAGLDIVDDGEYTGDSDGKLRGSEVASDITSILSLSGSLEAFLEATVKVGIDLGFFEVMKTVWSEELYVTLFEFELENSGGTSSQAYLEGSTVFFDSNLNGIHEEGEPVAVTNADGTYHMDLPLLFFDTNDNGIIDPEEGRIVNTGGTDTSSGLTIETPLIAPYGSAMVTPLTTLKQKLIEAGFDADTAEAQIEIALGLSEVDLEQFDPIAAIADGDSLGAEVYRTHVTVQTMFAQTTKFVEQFETTFATDMSLAEEVISAVAIGLVESGSEVELSNIEQLEDIIVDVLAENIPTVDDATLDAFTKTLADSIDYIDAAFNDTDIDTLIEDIAPVKQLVQGEVADLQSQLGSGEISEEELAAQVDELLTEDNTTATGSISITDSSGDTNDASIQFGTPLSQFRDGVSDSDLVRPNYPDTQQYIDITNTGDGTLTISDITINADNVTANLPEDDILLNPNETQRIELTYTPSAADESFNLVDGLVITSNAVNNSEMPVSLAGKSTFNSDINYDGLVSFGDLGSLNSNWGSESTDANWDATADINGDGLIGFGDLGQLNDEWNQELTSI